MKVFSPSQTTDYSFCPRYWQLRRQYVPRVIGYPALCGILGTAFSKAMEFTYSGWPREQDSIYEECVELMEATLEEAKARGQRLSNDPRASAMIRNMPDLLLSGIQLVQKMNPLALYTVKAVEKVQLDGGQSRPDMIVEDLTGRLIVNDWKVKVSCQEQWIPGELDRYERSWQMYHYCHFEKISEYMITLVVLGPKPTIRTRKYVIDPNYHFMFQTDAMEIWNEMNVDGEWLRLNPNSWVRGKADGHENKYGPCSFQEACLVQGLNPALMAIDYIPNPRRATDGVSGITQRAPGADPQDASASTERTTQQ